MGRRNTTGWIVSTVLAALVVAVPARGHDPVAIPEAIVQLVPGGDIEEINAAHATYVLRSVPSRGLYLLGLPAGSDPDEYQELLESDPHVEEAEVNDDALAPTLVCGDTQPFFFQLIPGGYADQEAGDLLNLGPAHAITVGVGVRVAVLDTGIDATHEAFAGNILPNGFNFVDGNTDVSDVGNDYDDDGDGYIDEMVGHGTLVAGMVTFVAPEAALLPVKVLDSDGTSDVFRIVQGIYYALDQGVHVINMSLSTHNHNHILRDAVEAAREQGVLVVAAAGNDDTEHPVHMPAGDDNVLGVASTDFGDLKAEFSNYGSYIGISGPGTSLVCTIPGNAYASSSGTSLSTALASGVAALLKAQDPTVTPSEIIERISASAVPLDTLNPEYSGLLGAGRIDAGAALDAGAQIGDVDRDTSIDLDDLIAAVEGWGEEVSAGGAIVGFERLLRILYAWH